MAFQLVLATDSEITVWHTDLGHIFGFGIDPQAQDLVARFTREGPDATQPAETLQDDARTYAAELARARHLIG